MYITTRPGWSPLLIVADFLPEGSEDYGEQELGETCWYPHVPSAAERAFAQSLLHAGAAPGKTGGHPTFRETALPWFCAGDC
jgi:hypothetical protein